MRIDAKGTIGQYPALLVRTTLRHLRARLSWGLAELAAAARVKPADGLARVKPLRSEGLIEAAGRGAWEVTQGHGRQRGQRTTRGSSSHTHRPRARGENQGALPSSP